LILSNTNHNVIFSFILWAFHFVLISYIFLRARYFWQLTFLKISYKLRGIRFFFFMGINIENITWHFKYSLETFHYNCRQRFSTHVNADSSRNSLCNLTLRMSDLSPSSTTHHTLITKHISQKYASNTILY
jgi:hypothetical protein